MIVVKVELVSRRDARMAKLVTITKIDDTVIYEGDASKDIVKKMDGAKTSHFTGYFKQDPKNPTKSVFTLDARLPPQGW